MPDRWNTAVRISKCFHVIYIDVELIIMRNKLTAGRALLSGVVKRIYDPLHKNYSLLEQANYADSRHRS